MAFQRRADLPDPDPLPFYLAPLPRRLEDLGLRLALPIAAVNLAGTVFGFWYYRFQFAETAPVMWPFVPDSPVATLLIALSLLAWRFDAGRWAEGLHVLAFFGCIKLGLWTPYVQLALNGLGDLHPAMYWFLIASHLAMAVEAFLIHRYAAFPGWAIAVAVGWHGANDVLDYFLPLVGEYHHTYLRAEFTGAGFDHAVPAHDLAAAAAVGLTVLATVLAVATRVEKSRGTHRSRSGS